MASMIEKLSKRGLAQPPNHLVGSVQYEAQTGSVAYGVSSDNSDIDIYGFCIPPKDIIFPHVAGVIFGFDKDYTRFDQYQQHHIIDKGSDKTYDITIFNIVKYFRLCTDGNPNMIDSLFVPRRCVIFSTPIGEIVRSNRQLFLSKKCWFTHKGYAYSQLSKMNSKNFDGSNSSEDRKKDVLKYGYSTKFAYHIVRLLNQAEQILIEHNLDITRNREQLKSIRRGEWTAEQIQDYFTTKERELESVYSESTLRHSPDRSSIKIVLLKCLEQYFGSIDRLIKTDKSVEPLIRDLKEVLGRYE